MASRAHLLAGLRTGGPKSSSSYNGDVDYLQQQQESLRQQLDAGHLNASAQPFTPGNYQTQAQMYEQAQMHAEAQALQAQSLQMESLRAQVATYHQQQLQQLAAQQRMAAQASIQANLRQLQMQQQVYLQMQLQQQLQQHQQRQSPPLDGSFEAYQEQQALSHRLQYLQQLQHNAASRQVPTAEMTSPDSAASWRSSPTSLPKRSNRSARDSLDFHDLVDSAGNLSISSNKEKSWRSTSTSVLKKKVSMNSAQSPPSIVVDDSASDSSVDPSETPETSEENITPSSRSKEAPLGLPRVVSLSAAPRSRTFSAEQKQALGPGGNASGGVRQPRGPPTEFLAVNFAARLAVRTRREAMSKLCASPRAPSFSQAIVA